MPATAPRPLTCWSTRSRGCRRQPGGTPRVHSTLRWQHALPLLALPPPRQAAAHAQLPRRVSRSPRLLQLVLRRRMGLFLSRKRLGLGRRLIMHAIDFMRDQGIKLAQIETMASNDVGQYLYPSCGFQEVGRQVHYAMEL